MKIIVTGSLGNISKPLTKTLVQQGHAVAVISSKPAKRTEIEALGAEAAIGSLEDVDFLIKTFTGADAVYCMIPPAYGETDQLAYYQRMGAFYSRAIEASGVTRIVHLSSMGAELEKGTGIILGSHHVEKILDRLPGRNLTHIRATYFYYNLYSFVGMIKQAGMIAANYGSDDKIVLVSPVDIAAAVADEITAPASGHKIRYVASDEHTATEIAAALGAAIGLPNLQWITISDEAMKQSLQANGVPELLANNLVEMYASLHNGNLLREFYKNRPSLGVVKLQDFVKEFAAAYAP